MKTLFVLPQMKIEGCVSSKTNITQNLTRKKTKKMIFLNLKLLQRLIMSTLLLI